MLVDRQVGSQGSDARSVTGRSNGGRREGRLGGAATPTPPAFRYVLSDHQPDLGKVEDLATFGADNLSILQAGSTRRAQGRCVSNDQVRVDHLGQMLAGRPGLLALLATSSTTLGTRR